MNLSVLNNTTHSYPLWYFVNDILVIIINIITILAALLFIYTIVRLDHPMYSASNLIACKACLAIGLMSTTIIWNESYALSTDVRGVAHKDSLCVIRGTICTLLYIDTYTSLCLKAFNRLRCIIYRIRSVAKSYKSLTTLMLIQCSTAILLVLPITLTNGVDYDWDSHLCFVTRKKPRQLIFLMIIYYVSITFIFSVYLYILYHVLHLALSERYRRRHRKALLRRILALILTLSIPGVYYLILIIHWLIYQSIPSYSLKLSTSIESIGHLGAVITIFISNTRLRRLYYKKEQKRRRSKKPPGTNHDLILYRNASCQFGYRNK